MTPRLCAACQKPLVRNSHEKTWAWLRRKVCDRVCRQKRLNWRGRREIPCAYCHTPLVRASPNNYAVCKDCDRKHDSLVRRLSHHRISEEARRYRILMTTLGFDGYEEAIAYLKTVPWTQFPERQIRNLHGAA